MGKVGILRRLPQNIYIKYCDSFSSDFTSKEGGFAKTEVPQISLTNVFREAVLLSGYCWLQVSGWCIRFNRLQWVGAARGRWRSIGVPIGGWSAGLPRPKRLQQHHWVRTRPQLRTRRRNRRTARSLFPLFLLLLLVYWFRSEID